MKAEAVRSEVLKLKSFSKSIIPLLARGWSRGGWQPSVRTERGDWWQRIITTKDSSVCVCVTAGLLLGSSPLISTHVTEPPAPWSSQLLVVQWDRPQPLICHGQKPPLTCYLLPGRGQWSVVSLSFPACASLGDSRPVSLTTPTQNRLTSDGNNILGLLFSCLAF